MLHGCLPAIETPDDADICGSLLQIFVKLKDENICHQLNERLLPSVGTRTRRSSATIATLSYYLALITMVSSLGINVPYCSLTYTYLAFQILHESKN